MKNMMLLLMLGLNHSVYLFIYKIYLFIYFLTFYFILEDS